MGKRLGLCLILLLILVMSWESQLEASPVIPKESIRLRILANSDHPQDQWIKRKVRDAIIAEVNTWIEDLNVNEIETARTTIARHLPEIEAVIDKTLKTYGFTYGYQVELGEVPFPTKVYGNKIYPAGEYEALRVTLGKGEGLNWWCVLFPPLCFVDITTAEYGESQEPVQKNTVLNVGKKEETKFKTNDERKRPKIETAFLLKELWDSWF